MKTGAEFIQKCYSAVEEERLYSTGNEELDAMLERAFSEGYEFAQKEFAKKEEEEKKGISKGAKAAAGVGAAAATSAAAIIGSKHIGKKLAEGVHEVVDKNGKKAFKDAANKFVKAGQKEKIGIAMQKPAEAIERIAKNAGKEAVRIARKVVKK